MSFLILMAATASSQAAPPVSPYYARTNTFSIFGAYSGDSSHILMGDAENRKLHSDLRQAQAALARHEKVKGRLDRLAQKLEKFS